MKSASPVKTVKPHFAHCPGFPFGCFSKAAPCLLQSAPVRRTNQSETHSNPTSHTHVNSRCIVQHAGHLVCNARKATSHEMEQERNEVRDPPATWPSISTSHGVQHMAMGWGKRKRGGGICSSSSSFQMRGMKTHHLPFYGIQNKILIPSGENTASKL